MKQHRGFILVGLVMILIFCGTAMAWPGFDWNTWQEMTKQPELLLDTDQAGRAELYPLLQYAPDVESPIQTEDEWEDKQNLILDTLKQILGQPTSIAQGEGSLEVLADEELALYRRLRVQIPGERGDPIPAYILLPHTLVTSPAPAMIVLHQTVAQGKREPVGLEGDPDMAFAVELAEQGVICIAPDMIGFGERIPAGAQPYAGAHDFYRKHPEWSFMGKMNWDVSRIVDYLETRPDVDKNKIGIMGHSHGAYGSIMAAIHEPRIAAVMASCGFTTLRGDPRPDRWSHLTALMPRLGYYVEDISSAPLDWHEIIGCLAPRPFFNWATLDDDIFPNTENLASVYKQVRGVYALYDGEDKFSGNLTPGKHSFSKGGRMLAFNWLRAQLQF